jgi:branched-subunit amino acid aminotransferase/4-amino-4-deoxychorismate lyase
MSIPRFITIILINNILAKIQANHAGVDSALMLDNLGFIAEMNGTNIFMVKNESVAYADCRCLSAWDYTRISH